MFETAHLKIERANQHIDDLKRTFTDFLKTHPHSFIIDNDTQTGSTTVNLRFNEQLPSSLSLIIGDAIHNLRSALDHANWELIGIDGGTQHRHTAFPMGSEEPGYKGTCNGIKTPRSDTKEFFTLIGAYKGGAGEILYALHCLDISDKHMILTPIASVSSLHNVKAIDSSGHVFATIEKLSVNIGPDGRSRIMNLAPRMTVEFDNKADSAIDIFFGNVEFFKFQPIIPTLVHLSDAVSNTVGQFDVFVRNRS